MKPRIFLNCIVKNESARIERFLNSLIGHIEGAVIVDTGSTDGTDKLAANLLAKAGVWRQIQAGSFHNFEQARNLALSYIQDQNMVRAFSFDYIMLADADMELVVTDPSAFDSLTEPVYQILQISGDLRYYNTRLIRSDVRATYRGVTHEYLDVGEHPVTRLEGAHFLDHADGANRGNKLQRDEALLREDIKANPDNARSVYYLAQTVRELGRLGEARLLFARRAKMDAWEEEAWHAKLLEARVYRDQTGGPEWINIMMEAYNRRPWRAEPLWELAKHFRLKDQHKAAWLFIERGMQLDETPRDDTLFIEEFPHKWGFKEEAQICGFYAPTPEGRELGRAACEELALSREAPFYLQDNAWRNLFWYARPLKEAAPSFEVKQITFIPPDGYRPMNPSVCRLGDKMVLNVRAVNYQIGDDGRYVMPEHEPDIRTRNFLFELHEDLTFSSMGEIFEPADLPPMAWTGVQGFEDLRLFASRGKLWSISSVRQLSSDGCNEMVIAMISTGTGNAQLSHWKVLTQQNRQVEKNWVPVMSRDTGWSASENDTVLKCFIYRCDPFRTVDSLGNTVEERVPPIVAREWGGSSQAIPFKAWDEPTWRLQDGYLMIVHERIPRPGFGQRQYQRRLVWLDEQLHIRKISRRFSLTETGQGEFCCGMCWHPDGERLVLSWGVLDREAWLGTISAADVQKMLYQPKALMPERPLAPEPIDYYSQKAGRLQESAQTMREALIPQLIFDHGRWDGIPRLDNLNPERAAVDDPGMETSVDGRGHIVDGAGSSSETNARPSVAGGSAPGWLREQDSTDQAGSLHSDAGGSLAHMPSSPQPAVSWLDRNTNSALKNEGDLKWAITCVQTQGWPTHLDTTKHWDSYIAIEHTLKYAAKDERILDAGADRVSIYLPTLAKLGYTKLLGLNLLESGWEAVGNIVYGRGNIEYTALDDEAFAFVASLSVIEHGVNTQRFLQEAARILRPGGHLFISTDYWRDPINTGIQNWKIFLPEEIEVLERHANRCGFFITGSHPLDLACGEKVCHHAGCSYTFINMLFLKK